MTSEMVDCKYCENRHLVYYPKTREVYVYFCSILNDVLYLNTAPFFTRKIINEIFFPQGRLIDKMSNTDD